MNTPDTINGAFELFGAVAATLNILKLLKDKSVKGVDWRVAAFWVGWGLWNLYYYPHLSQWSSFIGGAFVVVANAAWVMLALKYLHPKITLEDKLRQDLRNGTISINEALSRLNQRDESLRAANIARDYMAEMDNLERAETIQRKEDIDRAKSWSNLKESLKTRPADQTNYILYSEDSEGDYICRHCGGSYNFGHFPGCLYDADYRTDKRNLDISIQIRTLNAEIARLKEIIEIV